MDVDNDCLFSTGTESRLNSKDSPKKNFLTINNPQNQEFRKKLLKNLESIEITRNSNEYIRKQSFAHLPAKNKANYTKSLSILSHKPIASNTKSISSLKNLKKTHTIVVKSSVKPENFSINMRITKKPKEIETKVFETKSFESKDLSFKPNILPLEKTESDASNSGKYSEESEFEKTQKEYYKSFQVELEEFQSIFSKDSSENRETEQTQEKNKKINSKKLFILGNKIELNSRASKKILKAKEVIKNNSNICFHSNSSSIV